jgi:hypothetical protein
MAFELDIDAERDLVKVALKGPIGAEEFITGFDRMLAHPSFIQG